MSWSVVATAVVALFAVGVASLPMDVPATELLPPKFENEPKLATDFVPPEIENERGVEWAPSEIDKRSVPATGLVPHPLPEDTNEKKKIPAMLFVINVIAVKNSTAEDSNDVLHNDVIEEVPSEVAVPLALFLLVLEDEDENHPVDLDDIAKDLQKEGFAVEKVVKDGETRMVKVDLDTIEKTIEVPEDSRNMLEHEPVIQETGKLTSVRRKRHICLHCKLEEIKEKIHNKHNGGGYGGGGCGGGCGGGGYYVQPVQPVYQPVYQPVVQPVVRPVVQQPVYYQPPQQQYYPQQQHYPQQQSCNTCGGGGGGYGNGGGNAYAQASAQASASSSSGSYGR